MGRDKIRKTVKTSGIFALLALVVSISIIPAQASDGDFTPLKIAISHSPNLKDLKIENDVRTVEARITNRGENTLVGTGTIDGLKGISVSYDEDIRIKPGERKYVKITLKSESDTSFSGRVHYTLGVENSEQNTFIGASIPLAGEFITIEENTASENSKDAEKKDEGSEKKTSSHLLPFLIVPAFIITGLGLWRWKNA